MDRTTARPRGWRNERQRAPFPANEYTQSKTWEKLCARYAHAHPGQLQTNTNTMTLLHKLLEMREFGLLSFDDEQIGEGKRPVGDIKETGLWSKIRVALGGMSLVEAALLS